MRKCKIISSKKIGKKQVYNLEMKSKQHNYMVYGKNGDNGYIISKNSAAYAAITYQTAWLKTYYTTEFICAVLNSAVRKEENKFLNVLDNFKYEYKKLNILNPDINKSKKTFVPFGKKDLEIISPFFSIKGIGEIASNFLVENQPYANIDHFFSKIDRSIIDSKTLSILKDYGCLSSFGDDYYVSREIKRYEESLRSNKCSRKKNSLSRKNGLWS